MHALHCCWCIFCRFLIGVFFLCENFRLFFPVAYPCAYLYGLIGYFISFDFFFLLSLILHMLVSASVSVVSFRRRCWFSFFFFALSKTTENLLCQKNKKGTTEKNKKDETEAQLVPFKGCTKCVWSENALIRPVASWYTKTIYSHVINTCEAQTRCPEYCAYLLIGIVYDAHVFYGRRLSLLPASDIERFRWFLFCSTSNWFSV